jgi:hypothetical protein
VSESEQAIRPSLRIIIILPSWWCSSLIPFTSNIQPTECEPNGVTIRGAVVVVFLHDDICSPHSVRPRKLLSLCIKVSHSPYWRASRQRVFQSSINIHFRPKCLQPQTYISQVSLAYIRHVYTPLLRSSLIMIMMVSTNSTLLLTYLHPFPCAARWITTIVPWLLV